MIPELLNRFFGRVARNPATDWPEIATRAPTIDLATGMVGLVRFGCSLDEAQIFGRPTSCTYSQPRYCELLYASAGFQLDFDKGKLAYVAYFLAPDEHLPEGEIGFSSVRLVNGAVFSAASRASDIARELGAPASKERDEQEEIWLYHTRVVTAEFEFTLGGVLKRVNAFPRERDDE